MIILDSQIEHGQLVVERCHVGDAYLVSSVPGRKTRALLRYDRGKNTYTPVAYFKRKEDSTAFQEYMQEIIRFFAERGNLEIKGEEIPQ